MNIQDLVREAVAKLVAEKKLTSAEKKKKEDIVMAMKKDFKGPKSAMYAIATEKAKKLAEEYDFIKSAIESASGDKISHTEEDDYGRTIYWSTKNPNVNYFIGQGGEFEGKIYLYNGETGERYPIGDLKHYGDGQNHSADDDMHESKELDENKMDKEELKQAQIEKAYDQLEKMKANTRLFSKEDIKKAEERIEKLEAELDILAAKSVKESFDEATIRRWQHYAGIK